MRIHQRHQGGKSVVGNSEDTDFAVALGNIFYQPIDGVVGIGRVIDRSGIQRPVQRAIHHVIAFGAVLAADILHHANITALDDHFGRIVIAIKNRPQVRTGSLTSLRRGAVRRARKQHRRIVRSFGQNDNRVQLHPIAHGNHHVALDVVEPSLDRREHGRSLAGQIGSLGGARNNR